MALVSILENIGLTDKEAAVFLALLEFQEALPSTVSKKAKIKRPTTYVILEQLERKGLVSHVKKGRVLYYRALDPRRLLDIQHDRYAALEKALPELLQLHSKYEATPQMTIFEGKEGLIRIMDDTLTAKTELLCWADVTTAVSTTLKDYYPGYITKKVKNKIWLRGIFCYDKAALRFKKFSEKELREIYMIPKEKFPFKNEINIYDDKVAIISHSDQVGIIIQNKNIADTQRAIFGLGFEYAKILEKDLLTKDDKKYLAS
jgi:sugar-specific transcriptional regulator TrmB